MNFISKAIVNLALFFWYRFIGLFFRLLPIQNNKILFENFFGKGYGESPKYIAEELLKDKSSSLRIIWLIKGKEKKEFPPHIEVVKRGSLLELYHLSTAKIWIDNSRKHFGVRKRKGQYYMQVWHGSLAFKRIEKDINPDIWYRLSAKNDSRMADVLVSGSKWQTEQYQRCFWYKGKILEIGMPKNDFWTDVLGKEMEIKRIVYHSFKLNENKRIVLYAPTFRGESNLNVYNMDYERLIKNLEKYWGGSWVILIRLHPNIEKQSNCIMYSNTIINASNYFDINQLILASELVITDYSSCLFDAVYIKKPSIIYASDVVDYEKERGFAISLNASPASLAENNDELECIIRAFEYSKYKKGCKDFSEEYGVINTGEASKRAVEWIVKNISVDESKEVGK